MVLGSTKPLTKINTRDIFWWYKRPVHRADNLTTVMCRLSENPGSLKLLEPLGLV
jgi:hypothetical protein